MLKDISKKLTMKKTFFITQLEGFFNAISQEYQEIIHQKEIENTTLKEKLTEKERDIKNLVEIKNRLTNDIDELNKTIESLHTKVDKLKHSTKSDIQHELISENQTLKQKLKEATQLNPDIQKIQTLQNQIKKLQQIIAKGASYNPTLQNQDKEALIEEISKSLKK